MDEFSELLNFLAPRIANHPVFEDGFDIDLVNWLNPSGILQKSYSRWKQSQKGQGQSAEAQSRYLLELWKQHVGGSKATFDEFQKAITDKALTGQLIEDIERKISQMQHITANLKGGTDSGMSFLLPFIRF